MLNVGDKVIVEYLHHKYRGIILDLPGDVVRYKNGITTVHDDEYGVAIIKDGEILIRFVQKEYLQLR